MLASLVFIASGLVDSLDGLVARHQGRVTAFGAFLDSTLDRLAEGVILGAIGITLAQDGLDWALAACFTALTASFLVSYARARAEGMLTNLELVTIAPERIRALVRPCLPHLSMLIVNDYEIDVIIDIDRGFNNSET